jgi:hypothetical protein
MGTLVRFLDHRERPHDPLACWLDQWPSLGAMDRSRRKAQHHPHLESVGRQHLTRERQRRQHPARHKTGQAGDFELDAPSSRLVIGLARVPGADAIDPCYV